MAVPLQDLMSREPLDLPVDTPVRIHIAAVRVQHPRTGAEVELEGVVDFSVWDSCVFQLTDPTTGESKLVPGLCLVVDEVDGVAVRRRANVVSKRLVELLRPFLESGAYRTLRFIVTKRGERPRATFSVATEPIP